MGVVSTMRRPPADFLPRLVHFTRPNRQSATLKSVNRIQALKRLYAPDNALILTLHL